MNYIGPFGSALAAAAITLTPARLCLAAALATLLLSGAAYAQDRATVTLRSGVKVSGQLLDLGGDGYTVLVNGSERQLLEKDVSVIDFSGSDMIEEDWTRFTGTPLIVLKSGETIDGSLYDISGTTPLHLTIATRDGQRELASGDVARILFSRPEVAVGTSGRGRGGVVLPLGHK